MRQGGYSRCWARIVLIVCLLSTNSPVAYSSEPPPYPGPTEPVEGQCLEASIQKGPEGCSGVLLPTSWGADYLMWEDYGLELQVIFAEETDSLEARIDFLEHELINAQFTPWAEKPGVNRWAGRAEGLIIGALTGFVAYTLWAQK